MLAVRYANRGVDRASIEDLKGNILHPLGFGVVLAPLEARMHRYIFGAASYHGGGLISGILIFMVFLHFLLYASTGGNGPTCTFAFSRCAV